MASPRVLLLLTEFPSWHFARCWSYCVQFGLEEGLAANGVEFTSVVTPFQWRSRGFLPSGPFDQVWVEVVHNRAISPAWLEWIAGLAPVRVALVAESLAYTPEECTLNPIFAQRRELVRSRLRHFTHALFVDEVDATETAAALPLQTLWWPQAVPGRFCIPRARKPTYPVAGFCGSPYGKRARWLRHPALRDVLKYLPSPEVGTIFPLLFDSCYRTAQIWSILEPAPIRALGNAALLHSLRRIRRQCYGLWMNGMRSVQAVVNLPHLVKAYPGRIVEAMGVGRPVISWAIPDRPRTRQLFEDGKEIMLYSGREYGELATCIHRVLADQMLAERLVGNARRKVLAYHTMEKRVEQILAWIEAGKQPSYQ